MKLSQIRKLIREELARVKKVKLREAFSPHIKDPFGGCDEQAETDQFERLAGGPARARQLFNIYKNWKTSLNIIDPFRPRHWASSTWQEIAKREGFSDKAIKAFEHIK
jgi:hypothetical protein